MNEMNDQIQQLAAQMGVSSTDVLSFAQSIALSIEQDKVTDALFATNADDQTEILQAYAVHTAKKSQQFVTTYMTNPEARRAFQLRALHLLQEGE